MAVLPHSSLHTGIDPPLRTPVYFCLFNIIWTFVAGALTGNVSQVDRVWTFIPLIYTTYFTFYPTYEGAPLEYSWYGISERAYILWALQVIWSFRLSYNAWRRGLFSLSEEDYRWEFIRRGMPKWLFQVFNLVFIAGIQMIILFLFGLPAYAVLRNPTPLGLSDYILALLTLLTHAIQFTADNQQWSYQNFKHKGGVINPNEWIGANIQWTEDDRKRGFVSRGLWAWSRHPNFLCEMTYWILTCSFPMFASQEWKTISPENLTPLLPLIPGVVFIVLMYSSTLFSEGLSAEKYPAYAEYQKRVHMFLPPLTVLYGLFWSVWNSNRKQEIDEAVWGRPDGPILAKTLKKTE